MRQPSRAAPSVIHQLFAGAIIAFSQLQLFNVGRSQLRPVDIQRQLVDFAVEGERNLVVLVVHRGFGIATDVEVLIPLQDEWQSVVHRLRGDCLSVDFQYARSTLTDTADVVEGKRAHAEAVVLEVELQGMFARCESGGTLPLHPFQVNQVPGKGWLALQNVETISAEAPALGDDHAVAAALRNFYL